MSEFSQNGVVATLHDFSNRDINDLENDLKKFSHLRRQATPRRRPWWSSSGRPRVGRCRGPRRSARTPRGRPGIRAGRGGPPRRAR